MIHTPDIAGMAAPVSVSRCFDAPVINTVVNHPEVLPGLGLGMSDLDVTPIIDNPRNIILMGLFGGAMFVWTGPGVYEAHDFFLPEGRGKWALKVSRLMLSLMFSTYGAWMIWAQTPVDNRACRFFNRRLGFVSQGKDRAVLLPGHPAQEVEIFVLKGGDPCL